MSSSNGSKDAKNIYVLKKVIVIWDVAGIPVKNVVKHSTPKQMCLALAKMHENLRSKRENFEEK